MNDTAELILHGVGTSQLVFKDGSILPIAQSKDIQIKVDATTAEQQGGDGFYALLEFVTEKKGTVTITNATMSLADLKAVTGDDITSKAEKWIQNENQTISAGAAQLAYTGDGVVVDSVIARLEDGTVIKRVTAGSLTTAGARTYTVGTNAVAGDTLTLGGVTFTASSSLQDSTHFIVGATATNTATNIKTALNANATIGAIYTATSNLATFTLTEKNAGGGNTPSASSVTGTIVVTDGTATTSATALNVNEFTVTSAGVITTNVALNSKVVIFDYYVEDILGLAIHSLEDSVPSSCELRHRIITDEMADGKRYELNIRVYNCKAKGSYDYTAKRGEAFSPKLDFSILDAGRADRRTLTYSINEYTA